MRFLCQTTMVISDDALPVLESAGLTDFNAMMAYAGGERICHKRGRSTVRLQVGERAFYLKRNRFHLVEFLKGLSRLRLPFRGALREWRNIERVRRVGVPTVKPVAFGERPVLGIETCSFTMTEELYGCIPLDKVLASGFSGIPGETQCARKRRLIRQLGELARKLHGHGLFHQDFYLSHFFLDPHDGLHLIDLQRVLYRPLRARHFRIKDLAQLNYSAGRVACLSRTDRWRFLRAYLGDSGRSPRDKALIRAIMAKTARIARHDVKLHARRRRRGELP